MAVDSFQTMLRLPSIRLLLVENVVAVLVVLAAADRWVGVLLLGWALLLPGSLASALIEATIAPLTQRPSGSVLFWSIADVLYLPSCVIINLFVF